MYKKRGIFVLCCLAAVLVVGCGQKENKNTEEQIQTDNKQDTTCLLYTSDAADD